VHLARAGDVDAAHAVRRVERGRTGHQRHFGAGLARGARDRIAHLAGRQIRDAAHRVDRFIGRTGRDQHAFSRQELGLERCDQLVEQFVGFEHAAHAGLAAGLRSGGRAEDPDAVLAQL
jgi:hypothetical protein